MNIIIERPTEVATLKHLGPWIYIYGRRKTGKTFFVKNFMKWDEYFFVRRDGSLLDKEGSELSSEAFLEIFKRTIGTKTIVIDEIHRMPQNFFDYLHSISVKGRLIAISSTLGYSKKILGQASPLLGLFSPMCFGLIDEQDIIKTLSPRFKGEKLIEAAVYLREPWLLPKFEGDIREWLPIFLKENKGAIKALIGEIFDEEERRLSLVYEGILKAIADGKNVSTEISNYLFSRGLIPKNNPGLIQRYLNVLKEIGLIQKIEVFNSKKFRYFHTSPVFDLHYWLEEKYAYTETDVPTGFIKKVVEDKLPFHVEQFFANLLSKHFGLKRVIIEEPEIDIALAEFNKIKVVAEVKWGKVKQLELKKIEDKLSQFKAKKIIIVQNKAGMSGEANLIDCDDIAKFNF